MKKGDETVGVWDGELVWTASRAMSTNHAAGV